MHDNHNTSAQETRPTMTWTLPLMGWLTAHNRSSVPLAEGAVCVVLCAELKRCWTAVAVSFVQFEMLVCAKCKPWVQQYRQWYCVGVQTAHIRSSVAPLLRLWRSLGVYNTNDVNLFAELKRLLLFLLLLVGAAVSAWIFRVNDERDTVQTVQYSKRTTFVFFFVCFTLALLFRPAVER